MSETPGVSDTETCIVVTPAELQKIPGPLKEKHVTLVYLGDTDENQHNRILESVEKLARVFEAFPATVSGEGYLGSDRAFVQFLEAKDFEQLRTYLLTRSLLIKHLSSHSAYPHYVPHMTLSYIDPVFEALEYGTKVFFNRLEVWRGDERHRFPIRDVQSIINTMIDDSTQQLMYSIDRVIKEGQFTEIEFLNSELPEWVRAAYEHYQEFL